jgi:crotonobetainyl-CoA:carnitine CoA-transferase CaiB-like acyl-CoA transferase
MLPLAGTLVVSLEQAVAAPLATRHLADMGARVIKVERPGAGDFARDYDATVEGSSSHFVWLNRSKESLTLDLKRTESIDVLCALLDRADVFVQNLSPGAVERLGLDAKRLHARNPRLVICGISGYGRGGPYEQKKAYDLLIQAESGLLSVTGSEAEPAKAGIAVADISAGMYAYSRILAALLARAKSGRGTAIEISMLESLGEWMGYPFYYHAYGGSAPKRTAARHATIAPYGPFPVGDGGQIVLGIQNDREWLQFCRRVLGDESIARDPRFATNALRVEHRDALDALIERAFEDFTTEGLEAQLDLEQIAYARMRDMDGFAAHPQLAARRRWTSVRAPSGAPVRALLPPGVDDPSDCRLDPVPRVGEHNEPILRELGYSDGDIDALQRAGAI